MVIISSVIIPNSSPSSHSRLSLLSPLTGLGFILYWLNYFLLYIPTLDLYLITSYLMQRTNIVSKMFERNQAHCTNCYFCKKKNKKIKHYQRFEKHNLNLSDSFEGRCVLVKLLAIKNNATLFEIRIMTIKTEKKLTIFPFSCCRVNNTKQLIICHSLWIKINGSWFSSKIFICALQCIPDSTFACTSIAQ